MTIRWRRFGRRILVLGLVLSVLFILLVMLFENTFIYFPSRVWIPQSMPFVPRDAWMTAEDGVRIHGWFVEAPDAKATLLYLHGNAGNLSNRMDFVERLWRLPANVLIVDYRGYGRSEGSPDESGLYSDAYAAFDFLVRELKVPPSKIILFGKSLGGAVAAELATRVACGGVILQSTFTSVKEMSKRVLPILPASWFLRHRYDTLSKVPRIACPKLVLHAKRDEIVPYDMGRRLFEAAAMPKRFVELDVPGHNDFMLASSDYDAALRSFLRECLPAQ